MQRLVLLAAFLALAVLAFQPAVAKPPKGLNATDPSMVDEDFAYQGEYAGSVKDSEGREIKLGAQVIAPRRWEVRRHRLRQRPALARIGPEKTARSP